jgi:hypothetical protein
MIGDWLGGGIRSEIDAARSLNPCYCTDGSKLSGAGFASFACDAGKFRPVQARN